jgi:hypothetical protein
LPNGAPGIPMFRADTGPYRSWGRKITRSELLANARLIAAAPDMAEALTKIAVYRVEDDPRVWLNVNGFRIGIYPDDQETEIQKLLAFDALQRAALARARGEVLT